MATATEEIIMLLFAGMVGAMRHAQPPTYTALRNPVQRAAVGRLSAPGEDTRANNNQQQWCIADTHKTELCSLMVWCQALLPRQRLRLRVGLPITELLEAELANNGTIVLVASNAERTALLSHAVGVRITHYVAHANNGTADVELLGLRRCTVVELQEDHSLQEWTGNRWFNAAVRWESSLGATATEPARGGAGGESIAAAAAVARQAKLISQLVVDWEALVRQKRKRLVALDALLDELGPMPLASAPDELAFWTAALIEVGAVEIRSEVLTAPSAARRLQVVLVGLRDSMQRLRDEAMGSSD
eukprot:CAMPEP_0119324122 /NCGR_PEP_ID=MMETSP1333-20130426/62377_1 /TAXON_ID=418940 /ORGANISM="Scyphosphaera apsteinii, Strain RCC1455" /LENGTH=302 /DNA_ID=CAMNT_0007331741 /DNA_START=89 /DNA_END=998 /DNA_ORIENTATION=+